MCKVQSLLHGCLFAFVKAASFHSHLHGLMERLQQENKRLKSEVDERRIECERLKVSGRLGSEEPIIPGVQMAEGDTLRHSQ